MAPILWANRATVLWWGMVLGPDMELSESNGTLRKMSWRNGGSGLGSHIPAR